jgi:hypothetical protein
VARPLGSGRGHQFGVPLYFGVCHAVGSNPENGPGSTDLATYWTGSGTSWPAPRVAGIIALLLQVRPTATPAPLDAVLNLTAYRHNDGAPYRRTGGSFTSYDKGAGLVDAQGAKLTAWHNRGVRELVAHGEIVVIETDEDLFLGTCEIAGGNAIVRSGYVGRPVLIPIDDIESIVSATDHPDVETRGQ